MLRAVGPAVDRLLAVGANRQIAERMDVRQRAIDQRAEHVVAALVRRALVAAAPDDAAEIHLLQIDVHAGAPQLLGADSRQVAELADIGRRHDDDLLAVVAGLGQGLLDRRVIARAAQHLDPDIGGERRAGAEQTDAVVPIVLVGAGDRRHRLGLVDRAEQRAPDRRVVERRMQLVEGHDAVRRREMRDDRDVGVAADLVDEIARRVLPPVDLAAAQRRRRRKRIQGQPLDPIEMRHLRPGGEARPGRRRAVCTPRIARRPRGRR